MNDWLDGAFALPTRDGQDVGGAQERTMSAFVNGNSGIRTVEEVNPDGTITTLRTRQGWPVYETTGKKPASDDSEYMRGFSAKVYEGRAVLFDPHTVVDDLSALVITDPNYKMSTNTYHVSKLRTRWGLDPHDETHYSDVISFYGPEGAGVKKIMVNGKEMLDFRIVADHDFKAFPAIIYDSGGGYGNFELNGYQKRIFAVGRAKVKCWGGEDPAGIVDGLDYGVVALPRGSFVVGARVDLTPGKLLPTIHLGQLIVPPTEWNGVMEWVFQSAQIIPLLVAPYLDKTLYYTSVVMPYPEFAYLPTSTGAHENPVDLPYAEIAMRGSGRVASFSLYSSNVVPPGGGGSNGGYSIVYDFDGVEAAPLAGLAFGTYTREEAAGEAMSSQLLMGGALAYRIKNNKTWDIRNEATAVADQVIPIAPASEFTNSLGVSMTGDESHLYWGGHYDPGAPPGGGYNDGTEPKAYRGTPNKTIGRETIPGSNVTLTYEDQRVIAKVVFQLGPAEAGGAPDAGGPGEELGISGFSVVTYSLQRHKVYGPGVEFTGRHCSAYEAYLARDPSEFYNITYGFGIYNGPVELAAYTSPASDITYIRSYGGEWIGTMGGVPYNQFIQPASKVNDINNKYQAMAYKFVDQILFDSENTSGYTYRGELDPYYGVSYTYINRDEKTLDCHTTDYILFDIINKVFISVEGYLIGHQSKLKRYALNLTVKVRIKTRHSDNTITIFDDPNNGIAPLFFGADTGGDVVDMMPEINAPDSAEKYYVPSPKVRGFFAPQYQEQGTFIGAHYITEFEEPSGGPGEDPYHGFKFKLRLHMFDAVEDILDNMEPKQHVHIVPCNLLDMLYAFFFSHESGLYAERYPVMFPAREAGLRATLFKDTYSICDLNGGSPDALIPVWTDRFGPDFAASGDVSLHRT